MSVEHLRLLATEYVDDWDSEGSAVLVELVQTLLLKEAYLGVEHPEEGQEESPFWGRAWEVGLVEQEVGP